MMKGDYVVSDKFNIDPKLPEILRTITENPTIKAMCEMQNKSAFKGAFDLLDTVPSSKVIKTLEIANAQNIDFGQNLYLANQAVATIGSRIDSLMPKYAVMSISKVLFNSQVLKSFETLKQISTSPVHTHLKYIFNNFSSLEEKISIPIDIDVEIDISSENLKEVSKEIDSIYPMLTKEENQRLALIICILLVIQLLLLTLDENQIASIEKFLFSLRSILKNESINFSKGVLESLNPHELGKQFGAFVSGFFSSFSVVKTKKVFKNKKCKKHKKRKK